MKILYVASDFNRSGAALAMVELADNMRRIGNDVTLLFPGVGDAVKEASERGLDARIIRSYEWTRPTQRKESLQERLKWSLKYSYNPIAIRRIRRLIEDEGFDLVHNNTLWGYVGAAAAVAENKPLVWHMREMLRQQQQQIHFGGKGYDLIRKADAQVAISRAVYECYEGVIGNSSMHLIYDGIETAKYIKEDRPLFANGTTEIIMLGGVRVNKRQEDAIKAVETLAAAGEPVHMRIVGDDTTDYADALKRYVKARSLDKQIEFVGEVKDVANYLWNSDIAVVPSNSEAFGRVTVEAMLAGCVVVVSASGANLEIVEDGRTGFVFGFADSVSLANAIKRAAHNRDLSKSIANAGTKFAIDNFDVSINVDKTFALYEEVLQKRSTVFHGKGLA